MPHERIRIYKAEVELKGKDSQMILHGRAFENLDIDDVIIQRIKISDGVVKGGPYNVSTCATLAGRFAKIVFDYCEQEDLTDEEELEVTVTNGPNNEATSQVPSG